MSGTGEFNRDDMHQERELAAHDIRLSTLEKWRDEMGSLLEELLKNTSALTGSVRVLKSVMYAILSVTVLGMLGMILQRALG